MPPRRRSYTPRAAAVFASPSFWIYAKCCPGSMPSELAYFYSRTRAARKVIVVDLGFLGDTVHLVPALWELKDAYPQASLQVLTTSIGAEVLRLAPCVDRSWAIEMQPRKRSLKQQGQII